MISHNKTRILQVCCNIFLYIGGFLILIFGIFALASFYGQYFMKEDNSKTVADGFTIKSYDVILDVDKDDVINVSENVTVHFYESGHHGIYRFIPEYLKYTDKTGKTKSRKALISSLRCVNEDYEIDSVKRKKRIKIGSPYRTLDEGDYTYQITYEYDMGKDPYKGFDELIFHAFGDYWGTEINNASVTVNMPKSVDANDIHFFADKKREDDITSKVDCTVNGNTIVAKVSPKYDLNQSLTIDVELPEGYFEGGSETYSNIAMTLIMVCLGFCVFVFLLWLRFGKKLPDAVEVVEFYPPFNLDASQIGYLYKSSLGSKLAIALIVELASKGFVEILDSSSIDTIKVVKVQEPPKSISTLTKNETIVYKSLFVDGDEVLLKEHTKFHEIYSIISENVRAEFQDKMNDMKSYVIKLFTSMVYSIFYLMWVAVFMMENLNPSYTILYYVTFFALVAAFIFITQMHRTSSYGETVKAKINGFRNYLEVAEKDRINMLVEENPNYFFDILPYAYVLDVSKKWISKFPIPNGAQYEYISNIDMIYESISYVDASTRSSSSCSSCGGGCSSCGGGCSSCGGGGSW